MDERNEILKFLYENKILTREVDFASTYCEIPIEIEISTETNQQQEVN